MLDTEFLATNLMNRRLVRIVAMVSLIFFTDYSQPDDLELKLPRVVTNKTVFTSTTGALFEAVVFSSNGNIIDHGFQWRKVGTVDINYASEGPLSSTSFYLEVNSGFEENITYEVRAFITTSTHKAFGEWIRFSGAGSLAPLISDINPIEGTWGDTVTIAGKYFSNMTGNAVEFDGVASSVVYYSDSLMRVKVPFGFINKISTPIRIKVGSKFGVSAEQFSLLSTELTELNPVSAGSGEEIIIKGKYFNPESTQLLLDQIELDITGLFRDSLKIFLPKEIPPGLKDVTVVSGPFRKTLKNAFNRKAPVLLEINPPSGFFGDTVTFIGENFGSKYFDNAVRASFYDEFANIVEAKENELKVIIPKVPLPELKFKITADYVTTESDVKFKIRNPEIIELSPNGLMFPGQVLSIKGDYFYPSIYNYPSPCQVKVGDETASVIASSRREVKIHFPLVTSSNSIASIVHFDTIITKSDNPIVTPVTRISKFPGEQLSNATSFTIGDKAYILSGVSFGTLGSSEVFEFNMESKTWRAVQNFPGELRQKATAFSLNSKGYVLGGYTSSGAPLRDLWEYDPANDSWTKKNSFLFHPLETFNLGGRIFCISDITFIVIPPSEEIQGVGYETLLWEYDNVQDSWIKRSSPSASLKRNGSSQDYFTMQVDNSLIVGDYISDLSSFFYKQYNVLEDKWEEKGFTEILGQAPIGFDYGGKGYLLTNGYLYEFNPNLNQWKLIEKDLSELLWFGGQPVKLKYNDFWYFTLFEYNGKIIGNTYYSPFINMVLEFDCRLLD